MLPQPAGSAWLHSARAKLFQLAAWKVTFQVLCPGHPCSYFHMGALCYLGNHKGVMDLPVSAGGSTCAYIWG